MKKLILITSVILLAAFAVGNVAAANDSRSGAPAVQAQDETVPPTVAELNGEFLLLLVSITGFIKARFPSVQGNTVLAIGFGVGLFLYFSPLLLPLAGPYVNQVVEFVKWFIAGAGSFDTTVNILAKAQVEGKRLQIKADLL